LSAAQSALPSWHSITAILGGRFDPPHLGHRQAVRGLFECPGVKAVRIVPSAIPPHKATSASQGHRAEMARINFSSTLTSSFPATVEIDLRELARAKAQPNIPSYTYDTLLELKQEFMNSIAFVIGADQLAQLPTWHRFPEILSLSHWIVLERMPNGSDTARATLRDWKEGGLIRATQESSTWQISQSPHRVITVCPTQASALTSTEIRESIALHREIPTHSLLPEVFNYLKANKLYGI
jgi:nicotinate-nucleotide adenylyltransferase